MRILVIEDNEAQRELLRKLLTAQGFSADGCGDGESGLYALETNGYDLAILDRMLPEMDGITLLRQYRSRGGAVPVILLTALSETRDRVAGLDAGADDYLPKPFDPEELLARVRALLRRPAAFHEAALELGGASLSPQTGHLTGPLGSCSLSGREAALLHLFFSNPGQTLSRETLLLRIWGQDSSVELRNIDNFIVFLRRRLKNVGCLGEIRTVRGLGYRMEVPHA